MSNKKAIKGKPAKFGRRRNLQILPNLWIYEWESLPKSTKRLTKSPTTPQRFPPRIRIFFSFSCERNATTAKGETGWEGKGN